MAPTPRAACTLLLLLHASLAVLLPPLPTYAMHKPRGVLSAASDADPWRRTLTDVMADAHVDPLTGHIGRLDLETSGLLLITADGLLLEAALNIPRAVSLNATPLTKRCAGAHPKLRARRGTHSRSRARRATTPRDAPGPRQTTCCWPANTKPSPARSAAWPSRSRTGVAGGNTTRTRRRCATCAASAAPPPRPSTSSSTSTRLTTPRSRPSERRLKPCGRRAVRARRARWWRRSCLSTAG
mmetsp:Transcript_73233/g.194619  ORF Transcript_73233/g.194619 Transcript_73233/m.194619 type:complete len:241 (+) Transcript_73233:28-750(+)